MASLVISPMMARFWHLVREISPAEVAREAEQSFCMVIAGRPGVGKSTLRGALNNSSWPSAQTLPYLRIVEGYPAETHGAAICVYVVDASRGLFRDAWADASYFDERGIPVVYAFNKMDLAPTDAAFRAEAELMLAGSPVAFIQATDAETVRSELAAKLIKAAPDLTLALGRRFPTLREAAAADVIARTSRANAEFAFISSIPSGIPILSLGTAGADMAVLTKNQAMMLVKLAAIYGRPLDSRGQLFAEILPVVGAAFFWRTVARTVIGLLPGFIAAAPKMIIAFAGTYVVGRAAQYYYRVGIRPSREVLDRYTAEAIALARRTLPKLQKRAWPHLSLPNVRFQRLRALLPPGRSSAGQPGDALEAPVDHMAEPPTIEGGEAEGRG